MNIPPPHLNGGPPAPAPAAAHAPADAAPAAPTALPDLLTSLAEVVRLRILRLLEQEELTVGEVARVVQLPQSTVSRHLKVLFDAGWLTRRPEGAATFYRVVAADLPPSARALWHAVRPQLGAAADSTNGRRRNADDDSSPAPTLPDDAASLFRDDDSRLHAVLAERMTDSMSYFGRVAGEWDAIRADLFGRGFTTRALIALLPPDWTIADLGCGTGNVAEHVAPFVRKVIAVDQSAPMLKAAKKRLKEHDNIEFLRGDLTSLPLDDASVDAATCALVLHHLADPAAALAEVHRILKPGGLALILDMRAHDRAYYRTHFGHKHLGFTEKALRDCFSAAGLEHPRITPLPDAPDGKGPGLFVATARKPLTSPKKRR